MFLSDITNMHVIFGPDLPGFRRKKVSRNPMSVETGYVDVPNYFYQFHKFVTLNVDVMFVNGLPFMTTISRKSDYLPLIIFQLVWPSS